MIDLLEDSVFEGIAYSFEFLENIFLKILDFITKTPLARWFIVIPVSLSVLLIVAYFVFDLSHILDDYNAKNSMLYKGYKRYEKEQIQNRKNQERQFEKTKNQNYRFYSSSESSNKYLNSKFSHSKKKYKVNKKALNIDVED